MVHSACGSLEQTHRLDISRRRNNRVRRKNRAIVKLDCGHPPILCRDPFYAAFHAKLAAAFAIALDQFSDDPPHALPRPSETLKVNALEHGHELRVVHVVLLGVAVVHQGAQQHIDECVIAEELRQHAARGRRLNAQVEIIVGLDVLDEPQEVVRLSRKLAGDFVDQQLYVVIEANSPAGKTDGGVALFAEVQSVAGDAELAEQLGQRRVPHIGPDIVRQGVQADVKSATVKRIKRIQPAEVVVSLDDTNTTVEHG